MTEMPAVSVIVVTLNEGENLRRTVENLQASVPPGGEIIVVDDGSTDGSTDFLQGNHSSVRLLRPGHENLSKARDSGAREANGDVLVFSDAHIAASPGWWQPIVDLLANPEIGSVGPALSMMGRPDCVGYGQVLAGPDLEIDWLDFRQTEPYPVCMVGGAFLAMRKDTFQATGGFDEGMIRWGSEDTGRCACAFGSPATRSGSLRPSMWRTSFARISHTKWTGPTSFITSCARLFCIFTARASPR